VTLEYCELGFNRSGSKLIIDTFREREVCVNIEESVNLLLEQEHSMFMLLYYIACIVVA